jgi:tetratricopeptide (TPR) repeat protein
MRFCPHCGAPLMAGAKFCVECGRQLGEAGSPPSGASAQQKPALAKPPSISGIQLTNAFVVVFVGITIIGFGAAAYILMRPLPHQQQMAQPGVAAGANAQASANQGSAPGKGSQSGEMATGQLPPGHPKIELPTEARSFIDKVEQEAKSKPSSVKAWVKLGTVSMRAALFDQSYYEKASAAWAHVLQLDPENLDALRGIGDIDYDQQRYDQASAAYEHYLKLKPDDPEVLTDLGTMYLYTGNADQAMAKYKKAISLKPDLFQPYYNLGIAYGEQGDKADAAVAFTKAISLAPDDDRRNAAKQAFTKYTGLNAEQASKVASTLKPPAAAPAQQAAASRPAAASKTSPEDAFHSSVEEMVRGLPVAGNKVNTVRWADSYKAMVFMNNFPMEAMPPFAKDKFISDLKAGLDSAKNEHKVTNKVEVDIVDAPSGKVMQTVSE